MTRRNWMFAGLVGTLLFGPGEVRAQEPPPEAVVPPMMIMRLQGPEEPLSPAMPDAIELLGFEGEHGGKVVKGSPFTATGVSETTQTLADGNRIYRKTQTAIFRDGEGRIRKEVTLPAIGPLAASGEPHSFTVLHDPVAGTSYVLETKEKIARKLPGHPGKLPGTFDKFILPGSSDKFVAHFKVHGPDSADMKTESLGTQTIEGVSAEGTRYTHVIPAGKIGNDKPIEVASERWYSADLQMVVMSKRSDPRFGVTTYTLTNIQRQEPAASLFQVPADFTVKEGGPGMHMRHFEKRVPPPGAPGAPPPGDMDL